MEALFYLIMLCGAICTHESSSDTPCAIAISISGDVVITRDSTDEDRPLHVGSPTFPGDKVTLSSNSTAFFMVKDGSIFKLKPGESFVFSSDPDISFSGKLAISPELRSQIFAQPCLREGEPLGSMRSCDNLALAPRRTKIDSEQNFYFIWKAKPDVRRYQIALVEPTGETIKHTVEKTCIPNFSKKINPDLKYFWEVRDATDEKSFVSLGLGEFSTLSPDASVKLQSIKDEIKNLFAELKPKNETTQLFLLFKVYRSYEMYLDALLTLEKLIAYSPHNMDFKAWRDELCRYMNISKTDVAYLQSPESIKAAQ